MRYDFGKILSIDHFGEEYELLIIWKSHQNNPAANGEVQKITPESAGWEYVGFEMYHLQAGQTLSFNTETTETCFVLVSGKATVSAGGETYNNIGNRTTPFEKIPPYSVYAPHHQQIEIKAETYLELAVCRAPSSGDLPVRLITLNKWE